MIIYSRTLITLALIGALANCGGGGGGSSSGATAFAGNTTAATASEDNKDELANAARYGTSHAIETEGQDVDIPFAGSLKSTSVKSFIDETIDRIAKTEQSPSAITVTESCGVSGSFTINFAGVSENSPTFPTNGTFIIDYNNCAYFEDDQALDGTLTFSYTGYSESIGDFAAYDAVFNFNYGGEPFNGVVSCTNFGETCTFNQDFTVGGISYRVEDSTVTSGSSSSSYNVSATIYHETEGYVSVVATNVTIDSNGNVCSGSIAVYDSNQDVALTVDFPDCDTFTLTYNGVAETYSQ